MTEYPWNLSDCWAKTDPATGRPALTVRDHCLIVGAVAEAVWGSLPAAIRALLPPGSVTLAALHDIGKLTAGFLAQCEPWKFAHGPAINRMQNGCRKHAWISQIDLETRLGTASRWALALGGHHGRFSLQSKIGEHLLSARTFRPLRDELAEELVKIFGPLPVTRPQGREEISEFPQIAVLCGFVILCDWLGSDETNFPLPAEFPGTPLALEIARLGAIAAVERRQISQPTIAPDLDFGTLFTAAGESAYRPNPLQEICAANLRGPGLHLIEAPMGMGKTEAALWVAAKLISGGDASGLYFALPTQLTSNKIHERVAAFLAHALPVDSSATLALAHAASWLENPATFKISAGPAEAGDKTDATAARTWFTSRRALLARYGVGTIDQALMAALPVKFAALRLFGLAAKVVVLDEVHTYDAYTAKLLDRLIGHLLALRCTVIVLSATLTKSRRAELLRLAAPEIPQLPDDYPLLSSCEIGGAVKSIPFPYSDDLPSHEVAIRRVDLTDASLPEPLLEEIQDRARQGQRVLVIRNTVALAQETFTALRLDGLECGLLHSRFPFHVRNGHPEQTFRDPEFPGREAKWVARLGKSGPPRPGCILVATQVAEQSLDIDADFLVTDLCPADMLLQRIGRLWRHMRHRPLATRPCPAPETWVLVPDHPAAADVDSLHRALLPHSAVYDAHTLLRMLREMPANLRIPHDIRHFLEAAYAPLSEEPPAWTNLRDRMENEIRIKSEHAGLLTANPYLSPFEDDDSQAPTRYRDQPTVDLVLLAAEPRTQPGGALELRFHSGEKLEFRRGVPWTFPIARSVFLSTVRVAPPPDRESPAAARLAGAPFPRPRRRRLVGWRDTARRRNRSHTAVPL